MLPGMDTPPTLIRDQADLERLWRSLMEPLGFSRTSLWLLVVEADGTPVRQLVEVDEAHEPPDADQWHGFVHVLGALVEDRPGARVAFLHTRPGRDGLTDRDRRWAEALYDAAREAGVPCEVVHAANDVRLVPVPLDELPGRRSA